MTINETSFFRDHAPFEMLREVVLPELIARRRRERRLRIWSAASSTGQEAYSVAMLLCEYFPELAGWDVQIVGTDISQQVLETAQAGAVSKDRCEPGASGEDAGEVSGAGRGRVDGVADGARDV